MGCRQITGPLIRSKADVTHASKTKLQDRDNSNPSNKSSPSTTMETTSPGATAPEIKFRAGKKRKAYRQRTDDEEASTSKSQTEDHKTTSPERNDDDEPSVAVALKLRNVRKSRLRGVNFTTTRPDSSTSTALIPHVPDESEPPIGGIANRFTHQTGVLADINDKHMYAHPLIPSKSCAGTNHLGWSI